MQPKRTISPIGLLLATVSAIIGSEWLFSSFYAAKSAGPASILSWIIGGVSIMIIAFTFAEVCTLIPVSGSSTRSPKLSHGTLTSFIFSWMIWLCWMALVPTEVQAVVQYSTYFYPGLAKTTGHLTNTGLICALILMLILSAINTYSVKWLIKCNNALTILKFFIPAIIAIAIIFYHNHIPIHAISTNHTNNFASPHIHGVLSALSSAGIVFAFNGFKQAAEMAGEAKNPSKAIPIAIIGSIIACLILFVLLQYAFLASLTPENIKHGWQNLTLHQQNSPLFSILQQDHLLKLGPALAVTAIIAPLAAGLIYVSSASRSLAGISENGQLPEIFKKCSPNGNPVIAIIINFIIGMVLFFPLPGWDQMVKFLTSIITLTYAIAPISLLALRKQLPEEKRPFKLPFANLWCYISFTLCTLFAYWCGWDILSKLDICLAIGLIILFLHKTFSNRSNNNPDKHIKWNFRESIWVWVYLIGLLIISYSGNYNGHGLLSETLINIIILVFCFIIVNLAIWCRLPSDETQELFNDLCSSNGTSIR